MNRFGVRGRQRPASGSILIEMTKVLFIFLTMLAFLTLLGRYFWYYNVAQKAAFDGARFLSTASRVDMSTMGPGGTAPAAALARQIVLEELSDISPHLSVALVQIDCDAGPCGDKPPAMIHVTIILRFKDDIFPIITSSVVPQQGMRIFAQVSVTYAGI